MQRTGMRMVFILGAGMLAASSHSVITSSLNQCKTPRVFGRKNWQTALVAAGAF